MIVNKKGVPFMVVGKDAKPETSVIRSAEKAIAEAKSRRKIIGRSMNKSMEEGSIWWRA
jgi:hypothetical protein